MHVSQKGIVPSPLKVNKRKVSLDSGVPSLVSPDKCTRSRIESPKISWLNEDSRRLISQMKGRAPCYEAEQQTSYDDSSLIKEATPENIVKSCGASPCIIICASMISDEEPLTIVLHSADLLTNKPGKDEYNATLKDLKRKGSKVISPEDSEEVRGAKTDFDGYITKTLALMSEYIDEIEEDVLAVQYSLIGSTKNSRGFLVGFRDKLGVRKEHLFINDESKSGSGLSVVVVNGDTIVVCPDREMESLCL